jgi:AcrR family transcriptional regulator
MTDEQCAPGLREQKRRATRRALELALLRLALDRGFENVTIEEACRVAQVSARTFFNYFASKEDAVAGSAPFVLRDDDADRFVEGEADVLTDLVQLVARNVDEADDLDVHRLRKALIERNPHLLGVKIAETRRFHEVAVALAVRRLRADAERSGDAVDEASIGERANLVVLVVSSILRHGWSRWVGDGGAAGLRASILTAYEEFRELSAGAIAADPVEA